MAHYQIGKLVYLKKREGRMTYPKIQTLFERNMQTHKVTDKIRLPEFENIKHWLVTEKIDGTNVRVLYEQSKPLEFKGRTEKAEMPTFLLEKLKAMFPVDKVHEQFKDAEQVCLYGEGYGPRINKGGIYREADAGVSFRLIDVWINGWWLKWEDVLSTAWSLGIKTVPTFGVVGLQTAIELVQANSVVAKDERGDSKLPAEGVVARSYPLVLFRNGNPLVWKLKKRDYKEGKK